MAHLRILTLLVAVALFVGCGAESVPVDEVIIPAQANAKMTLEEVAETGELGSGAMILRENLQECEAGKALLSDMDALEGMRDPAQIKAKAAEMAGKL